MGGIRRHAWPPWRKAPPPEAPAAPTVRDKYEPADEEMAPMSTETASDPATMIDENGHPLYSSTGEVEVLSDHPGTFALANGKHKPLPPAGDPKAVFIPNGTKGTVRSVGPYTAMVDFGPPVGLVHVRKSDLRSPHLPEMRRRWSEAPVRATAAGLVDVTAVARATAGPYAKAIIAIPQQTWQAIGDLADAKQVAWEIAYKNYDRSLLRDWGFELSNPAATKLVGSVQLAASASASDALASFSPDHGGSIHVHLGSAIYSLRRDSAVRPGYETLIGYFEPTLAHEIRHAADWAYSAASDSPDFMRGIGLPRERQRQLPPMLRTPPSGRSPEQEYFNTPTELKSYAGNFADFLFREYGPRAMNLSGNEMLTAIQADPAWSRVWRQIAPENRKRFLQRVVKGLEQLVAAEAGPVRAEAGIKEWVGGTALGLGLGLAAPVVAPHAYNQHVRPTVKHLQRLVEAPAAAGAESPPGRINIGPGEMFDPETGKIVPAVQHAPRVKPIYVPKR